MHKPTAVRGFCVGDNRSRSPLCPDAFSQIIVGRYRPNGSTEAEFSMEFRGGSVTTSGIDMRLCAYDDALGFLASCGDLLTALAPLRDRCTVGAVRKVLLDLGFVEFGA